MGLSLSLIIALIAFALYFQINAKKALLLYLILKLPLDQITWQFDIDIGFASLRGSEFLTTGFFVLCCVNLLKSFPTFKIPKLPILLYTILFSIQIFREPHIIMGLRFFFQMVGAIGGGLVFAKYFNTEEDIAKLINAVLLGAIVVSILDLPAIFSGGRFTIYYSPYDVQIGTYLAGGVGNYYSADSFAHALIVNIPIVLLGLAILQKKWQRLSCIYFLCFSFLGVFSSVLRAGWVSFMTLMVLWTFYNRKSKMMVAGVLLIVSIVTIQSFSEIFFQAYGKIESEVMGLTTGNVSLIFEDRTYLWDYYWKIYQDYPLLDKIIGSSSYLNLADFIRHDPHNDFLMILLRMGIVGIVILLYLYGSIGLGLLLSSIKLKSGFHGNIAFTGLLSLIAMIIPAITRAGFTNPNYQTYFWLFVFIFYRLVSDENDKIVSGASASSTT